MEKRHLKSLDQINFEKKRNLFNTLKTDEFFKLLENERDKTQAPVNFLYFKFKNNNLAN